MEQELKEKQILSIKLHENAQKSCVVPKYSEICVFKLEAPILLRNWYNDPGQVAWAKHVKTEAPRLLV